MQLFERYFEYIIIFLLIYTSRETLLFGTNSDTVMNQIGYVVPIVTLCLLSFVKRNVCSSHNHKRLKALLIFLVLFTMVVNWDLNLKYGYEIILICVACQISLKIPFSKFVEVYSNIILFLSVFAIVTALLYIIYPSYVGYFPTIVNKGNLIYYNLGLAVIPDELCGVYFRMYGIFREPGVAIIFTNISLAFELFVKNVVNVKRILILVMAVFLTYSTAGYIVTFLLIFTYILSLRKRTYLIPFSVIGIICIAFCLISNDYIYTLVFDKFSNPDSNSLAARLGSVGNNLKLLLDNSLGFLPGLGFQTVEDAFVKFGERFEGQGHNTNTILKLLAVHGFILFCVVMKRLYTFFMLRFIEHKYKIRIFLFMTFLLMLGNEDLIVNVIFYIIVFYSLKLKFKNTDGSVA